PFKSEAVECPLTEIEEDDANFEPDVQDEENEEEEFGEEDMTEEDPRISKKRQLGEVGHYCPVMLKEKRVLVPGRPEKAAKYENKTYYVSSLEMLEQFISQPEEYVPVYEPFQPPPFRICIIGVSGAGKTVYGRYLANKLKVYHISFREKLQELIIKRTKKKLGPRYEEDPDSEAEQPPPEEEIKPFDEPKPPKVTPEEEGGAEEEVEEEPDVEATLNEEFPVNID
ncbi:hypothetical protein Ahia01_000824000, partial [Argonauta hians]